ncbi:PUA domain-containing protein [Chryseobacterium sp.]|uniref:nSTAND3 domain-containing NTPase n=1 Tax=Chryseobacterium sp. TaxID=1871047 RepID=UPI0023F3732C|nr:PUA domain-containing protein [Chryseobacterium sp.]
MIEIFDLNHQNIQETCRLMVCQFNSELFEWEKKSNLYFLKYNETILLKVNEILNISKQHNIDLLIFPELSIPVELIEKLQNWSKNNEIIIVAGSHYHKTKNGFINRNPIIIDGTIYFSEKCTLSPLEKSAIRGMGAIEGAKIIAFKNSRIGNFANLICADYLNDEIKDELYKKVDLDLLNISCFQRDSDVYYRRINIDCEKSHKGIYISYSNFIDKKYGDGRSAIFGLMDRMFINQLYENGYTDLKPEKKIMEIKSNEEFFICDIHLNNKRPSANRNIDTSPNFTMIESGNTSSVDFDFTKKIAHDDERYRQIEELFVEPNEFQEIKNTLEENNIVFIIGDPGIGKTYLAVKLLKEYYKVGYEPIWISGLDKEERDLQSKFLIDYEPHDKEIIYFEDPFGKISFEKRDGLYQVFNPLISKLKYTNCKIVITSRKEIFEKFTNESLLDEDVINLSKELNISKPSYSTKKLFEIYQNLSKIYFINDYQSNISQLINDGKLSTPLMIRDLISHLKFNKEQNSKIDLDKYVLDSKKDIVRNYSFEIQESDIAVITLLYLVLFSGTMGKPYISQMFNETIVQLEKTGKFSKNKSFNTNLRSQIGYRIEQFGYNKTAYKLSHPIYEESLNLLYLKYPLCENIVDTIINIFNLTDHTQTFKLINRFTTKQPELSLKLLYKYLDSYDIDDLLTKITLTKKLISLYSQTKNEQYFDLATEIYKLNDLINDLNLNFISWQILSNQLSLCITYFNNSPDNYNIENIDYINWDFIFSNKSDNFFNHSKILHLLANCYTINPSSIHKFIQYKGKILIKKVFLFSDRYDRKRLLTYTKGNSIHKELYRYKNVVEKNEKKIKNKYRLFRQILFNDYKYYGKIIIDEGAIKAISKPWLNLLAAGVYKVEGNFEAGQIVGVFDEKNNLKFVGVSEYSSYDLDKIKGCHSKEFFDILEINHTNWVIKSDFRKPVKNESYKWNYEMKN